MKNPKRILIAGVAAVGLAAVVFVVSSRMSAPETSVPQSETTAESQPAEAPQESTPSKAGAYVNYTEAAFAAANGTRILFFHAPWCPQCRQLDASIKAGTVPDGVTIFKVDYDSNQALRQAYGVTIQTTLVKVDADGKLVKKYVAYDDPTLASIQSNLLP